MYLVRTVTEQVQRVTVVRKPEPGIQPLLHGGDAREKSGGKPA